MPHPVDQIANEFLQGRLGEMSPMKLQKLVYYAHAWSLAVFDEPLIIDRIEAWKFGPVIPTLYHEFKSFGNRKIDRLAAELDFNSLREIPAELPEGSSDEKALVQKIWEIYGELTPVQLSNMTHRSSEPWSQIPKKRPGLMIPNELISRCFKAILDEQS